MDHSYSMKKSKFMRSELEEDLNTSAPPQPRQQVFNTLYLLIVACVIL